MKGDSPIRIVYKIVPTPHMSTLSLSIWSLANLFYLRIFERALHLRSWVNRSTSLSEKVILPLLIRTFNRFEFITSLWFFHTFLQLLWFLLIGCAWFNHLWNIEVKNLDLFEVRDTKKDIHRIHISVHYAFVMHVLNTFTYLSYYGLSYILC
jgi:hypothetical protein